MYIAKNTEQQVVQRDYNYHNDEDNKDIVTEMSTSNLPGGKARPEHNVENLTAISEPVIEELWDP
jgi:hypothetical protein